jgi:protocatechuate 3,4-dioxygenase beta subunit
MTTLTLTLLLVLLQTATPAASISGRIVASDGGPVPNAAVDALEKVPGSDELYLVQRVQTNERGEYRLFWLEPGSYYICAIDSDGPIILKEWSVRPAGRTGSRETASSTFWGWPFGERLSMPMYFPGAPDLRTATAVGVSAGAEMEHIDIPMRRLPVHKVTGVVEGTTDLTSSNPTGPKPVELVPRFFLAEGLKLRGLLYAGNRFQFSHVLPGSYDLVVTPPLSGQRGEKHVFPIEVGSNDNRDLQMDAVVVGDGDHIQVRTAPATSPTPAVEASTPVPAPMATISGRVRIPEKQPGGAIEVRLLAAPGGGEPNWRLVRRTLTDDRGIYHFFGLLAGRYYLEAIPGDLDEAEISHPPPDLPLQWPGFSPVLPRWSDRLSAVWKPSYYTNTTDASKAAVVSLDAGANLNDVDMIVGPAVSGVRVQGKVIDAGTGKPLAVGVRLVSRPDVRLIDVGSGADASNGEFEIRNVPPGNYYVISEPGFSSDGSVGSVSPIVVPDGGLRGVIARVTKTQTVRLHFSVDGPRPAADSLTVTFYLDDDLGSLENPSLVQPVVLPMPQYLPVQKDSAVLQLVSAGDHRLGAFFEGQGKERAYLKSAKSENTDLLMDPLHVAAPQTPQVNVVIGTDGGIVEGQSVTNDHQGTHAVVALIPQMDAGRQWSRYQVSHSDNRGHFRFEGVAPGSYKVLAWEDSGLVISDLDWVSNHLTRAEFLNRATHVTSILVDSNRSRNLELTINPSLR